MIYLLEPYHCTLHPTHQSAAEAYLWDERWIKALFTDSEEVVGIYALHKSGHLRHPVPQQAPAPVTARLIYEVPAPNSEKRACHELVIKSQVLGFHGVGSRSNNSLLVF